MARIERLAAYAALAGGVIPAMSATGAIVTQTGLDIAVSPGSPEAINFGPGFGEIFQFSIYTVLETSDPVRGVGSGFAFFSQHVVQFNNANTGGWTAAEVMNYAGFTSDDPARLFSGAPIDSGQGWYFMSQSLGTIHDLANFYSASNMPLARAVATISGSGGDWAPNERGFVGLRFTKNGMDYHHAWIDADVDIPQQTLTIHGWGFESTPNRSLNAGEVPAPAPVGLALLAMGAAGIRRHRRDAA